VHCIVLEFMKVHPAHFAILAYADIIFPREDDAPEYHGYFVTYT